MTPNPQRTNEEGRLADLAYDLLNVVAAIRGRAQLTRRRIFRVDDLSRDHIGADLEQIEAHAQRLTGLIGPLHGGGGDADGKTDNAVDARADRQPTPPGATVAPRPRPRPGVPPGRGA